MAENKFRFPITGRKRPVKVLILQLLLIYAAVVLLAYLFQNRLLYLPIKADLDQIKELARLGGLRLWPQDNEGYRGFISDDASAPSRGTVIVFHGNAGSAQDRPYYIQPLQNQGFRVILAEYPGYGARSGKTGEKSLVADGREIVRTALRDFGSPIYLWGESLGCGVAAAVAADEGLDIRGIVLLTPWNTLPETAQAHYWFLPARWLVRDQFNSIQNLKRFRGPVAVLMADKDEVIPNRLTQSLYTNILSEKRLWTFEDAGHNSWPFDSDLVWWIEVMDFVSEKRPVSDLLKP